MAEYMHSGTVEKPGRPSKSYKNEFLDLYMFTHTDSPPVSYGAPGTYRNCKGRTGAAQAGWVLHKQDGCCTSRMGAAQRGWALYREDACCTGKMGAAQEGWVLHREDGRCTARMGAAQQSEQRRKEDSFFEQSPQRHLKSLRKARIALQYRHTCSSKHRPQSNGQSAKRQAATIR